MNGLAERLRNAPDSRLWDILRHPAQYQPEALEIAREELQRRGLNPQVPPVENENAAPFFPEWVRPELWLQSLIQALFRPRNTSQDVRYRVLKFLLVIFLLRVVYVLWYTYLAWGVSFALELVEANPIDTGMTLGACVLYLLGTFLLWRRITAGWGIMMFSLTFALLNVSLSLLGIAWKFMLFLIGMNDEFVFYLHLTAVSWGAGWLLDLVLTVCIVLELNRADTRQAYGVSSYVRKIMFYVPLWLTVLLLLVRIRLNAQVHTYDEADFENIAPPVQAYPDDPPQEQEF